MSSEIALCLWGAAESSRQRRWTHTRACPSTGSSQPQPTRRPMVSSQPTRRPMTPGHHARLPMEKHPQGSEVQPQLALRKLRYPPGQPLLTRAALDQWCAGSAHTPLARCTLRFSTPCRAFYSSSGKSRVIATGHPPNHSYNDESAMPTPMFRQSIAPAQLRTKYLGRHFEYRDCTGSTMEDARRALKNGTCLNCAGPVCVCDGRFMDRHLRRAPVRCGVHG
jgi:hypothetical protein